MQPTVSPGFKYGVYCTKNAPIEKPVNYCCLARMHDHTIDFLLPLLFPEKESMQKPYRYNDLAYRIDVSTDSDFN